MPELVVVESHAKVGEAIELMQRYGISQIPVVRHEPADSLADLVGSLRERGLLDRVFGNPDALNDDVAAAMQPPLPAVELERVGRDRVHADLSGGAPPWWSPSPASRPACSLAPTCSSTSPRA